MKLQKKIITILITGLITFIFTDCNSTKVKSKKFGTKINLIEIEN